MASGQPSSSRSRTPSPPPYSTNLRPRRGGAPSTLSIPSSDSSSDDGYRMSPAAARRFARRNMRRASPTPDLVTSLVRPPPSPDSYYSNMAAGNVAPMHAPTPPPPRHSLGQQQQHQQQRSNPRPYNSPARRSGPALVPHPSSLDIPSKYGGEAVLDMYSLTYVTEPDATLLCPICHDPMIDPVTTPCDHTFCYRCLRRSIASSPSGTACPVDRDPLAWSECVSAGRLVRAQLNGLLVRCPNRSRGCSQDLRREAVETHANSECHFREYPCPDPDCTKKLMGKPGSGAATESEHDDDGGGSSLLCRHIATRCRYCDLDMDEADRERHLLTACPRSKTRCLFCWQLVCRSSMPAHHEMDCDGVQVACSFQDVGCPVRVERGDLAHHLAECPFHPETASGAVIRSQRDLLQTYSSLGGQLEDFRRHREDAWQQRFDDVDEHNMSAPPARRSTASAAAASRTGAGESSGASHMSDSHHRTMQDLDAGFEEVHQNLTHLEARQSMWTLNQVMPIREEVTELRNNINMMRMHVNWLLNRSREEGRIRAAANSSTNAAAATASSNAASAAAAAAIRRDNSSADGSSSGGLPAAFTAVRPVRRRSSGTDMDVPRL